MVSQVPTVSYSLTLFLKVTEAVEESDSNAQLEFRERFELEYLGRQYLSLIKFLRIVRSAQ